MKKNKKNTQEPQYDRCLSHRENYGIQTLGLMSGQTWIDDPKRLVFVLSRYKFAAKMLSGYKNVLEIGCADAFASKIVAKEVTNLKMIDFDPLFIEDARTQDPNGDYLVHDIIKSPVCPNTFQGAYSMDVLEHISKENEDIFLSNISKSLTADGTLIIGTPTLYSQAYASPISKEGHVNCKTHEELKSFLQKYFHQVFIFSMNDEVIHTGFSKMAHYFMAICCNPFRDN